MQRITIIIFLIILTMNICGCTRKNELPNQNIAIKANVNLGWNWSYTDTDLKKEYRRQSDVFKENAFLVREFMKWIGLEPKAPTIITSKRPLTIIFEQNKKIGLLEFDRPKTNQTTLYLDPMHSVFIFAVQDKEKQKISVIQPPIPAHFTVHLLEEGSILIYSSP
jgi:hypothetical protein